MSPKQEKERQKRVAAGLSARGWAGVVLALGAIFGVAVLIPGFELATQLANRTAALKFVGEQQRNADLLRVSMDSLRDRLVSRGYIQAPLNGVRDAVNALDAAVGNLTAAKAAPSLADSSAAQVFALPGVQRHAGAIAGIWSRQRQLVDPVIDFKGIPYRDSESAGTELNENGHALLAKVEAAIPTTRHALSQLDKELASLGTELQASNERAATELRMVMLAGISICVVLVVLLTILLGGRGKQARSLREARQQTEDILRTVKEGLFLLDRNLVIGSAYSAALEKMFHRKDLAGLAFEDLLRNVVSERTLTTAAKYVKLLWAERTKEKLIKSINPLGEVEVNLEDGQGAVERRYLEFDFHRVRVDDVITHVLVSVSDVTARVSLAVELKASQNQAQGQVDTLLGILHVDPEQLSSFLSDSNASMKMINAVLREPARDESVFRKKLDTLFRQAHSVKGEAAALGLSSIENRAHAFEDDLKALREKPGLSGNDFLPLVIKLDDLLTHLQSVSDLVTRLSRFQLAAVETAHGTTANIEQGAHIAPEPEIGLVALLEQLAERVAKEQDKQVTLQCLGFERIPDSFRRAVKDIAIQAVRNSLVHGIESPAKRAAAGKAQAGIVRLEFQDLGAAGFRLIMEDDGQGLSTERIKETAVAKGFITADEAATLDAKQVFALLFRPGFSTAETTSLDAGRGVGMNIVAELLRELGGRVAVSTTQGKYTRLNLTFPPLPSQGDDTEAA
jgi:HPt (histidine-containing phosphotransfer) domain-containing protein/PAS domain-containing protein